MKRVIILVLFLIISKNLFALYGLTDEVEITTIDIIRYVQSIEYYDSDEIKIEYDTYAYYFYWDDFLFYTFIGKDAYSILKLAISKYTNWHTMAMRDGDDVTKAITNCNVSGKWVYYDDVYGDTEINMRIGAIIAQPDTSFLMLTFSEAKSGYHTETFDPIIFRFDKALLLLQALDITNSDKIHQEYMDSQSVIDEKYK